MYPSLGTLKFIKVDSPTRSENNTQAQGNDNSVTIELPYPAVRLVVAQTGAYIPDTRSWAGFLCASFYDADDNELWHTEILIGSFPYLAEIRQLEALEALLNSDDPDSDNTVVLSPAHGRIHRNNTNVIDPDTFTIPDPNNENNTISLPRPQEAAAILNSQTQQTSRALANLPYQAFPPALSNYNTNYPYLPQAPYTNYSNRFITMSGGWNPRAGWDSGNGNHGSRGNSGGAPVPSNGIPILNNGISLPHGYNPVNAVPMYGYPQVTMPGQPFAQGPIYSMPANGYQHPVPVFQEQGPSFPHPHPVVALESAAANFQNSTGGVGCEPGYNYYFPAQHTKIHVIKSRDPPWRLAAGMSMHFGAYHVPCNTTLGDIMKGFGATNADAKKNRITEVNPGGNGGWYKGVTWTGDDRDKMALTLKDVGWDPKRSGRAGEKPVVWIWVTNT
ncbi:hypothetical protein PGQ11_005823 [Apiospora arundinis]|uniref:Uncharacterized protein n=1 Tax=Apiospora arundinis TaxID=335852 RepID=A0ABR2JCA3_9PEZI